MNQSDPKIEFHETNPQHATDESGEDFLKQAIE